jgi:hypothetical protein
MAENSLTDFIDLINQQIDSQEKIIEYLSKAQVLVRVSLGEDFLNFEKSTLNEYLSIVEDLINLAKTGSEKAFDFLLRSRVPAASTQDD